MRTAIAGFVLLLLAGCGNGDNRPAHTADEIESAYDTCSVRVSIAGPGTDYAGSNAAVVGCMRDELDWSFEKAKSYVQKRQEDGRWLQE